MSGPLSSKSNYKTWPKPRGTCELTEHRGVLVVAKPKGVPARWHPIYHELAAGMYSGGPSFTIDDSGLLVREYDPARHGIGETKEQRAEGWSHYATPDQAREALGLSDLEPKPRQVKSAPPVKVKVPRVRRVTSEAPPVSKLPTWATDWLERLEYRPKREYAARWLDHIVLGLPAPEDPGTEWSAKVRKRVDWLAQA